ncbi:2-polyprenyl-6-methoxyphenol hydroxylase-like FAD-dependent oxidoreductase [Mycobacterium sp. OAS707]|uniref:FAD-dependent oxidoreductase n=1 Tax=Mycobacterium sp. OAS707 TaxID=2663822 RepID=UPI001789A245|nr:FAD-dependent oxidoreductase [Mycobacterium sp. OAS707]MBE1546761.1 2-polyprenyl-6-methoxyphenol hydroxylase-like FAD-dependent oxidoreductase [Mycobacterium sp. OAS707]
MTTPILDVLVVGAGPVGTALAIDLTRRGLTVRVIDKADHAFDGSRAKGIQPRTLEVLEDLGALEEILAGGSTYPLMGIHLGPFTVPWRMMRSRKGGDDVPFPDTWLIPQFRTDSALHNRLRALGGAVEFHCEIAELTQTPDAVVTSVTTRDGVETITARFVIGADGGGSVVRKQVGIDFVGSTDEADRVLIVDAAVDGGLSRDRWHVWPGLRGRFVGACPLPHSDQFQWMIRLAPDESPPIDEAQITEVIRARTGDKRLAVHDIAWKSVFRPNIRLAQSYRRGRVFLAGDAAHVHTPAGAQGLNTGIQDAYNLGWKLGQVLAGGPPELLDTYETERQPIAAGVLGLSTKKYSGLGKMDPSSIRRGEDEQQLSLSYRGGPLAADTDERTATLQAGDRAPDAVLRDADGKPVRLFDVYRGTHFTALAYGERAARELAQLSWPAIGAPLRRVTIGTDTALSEKLLQDPAATFKKIYGLDADTLLLIRPDGYIASIATRDMLTRARAAISRLAPPVRIVAPSTREESQP